MRVAGSLIVPVGPTWVAAELADAAAVAAAVAGRSGSRVKSGTSGRSWKGGWSGKVGAKSARRELPDLNDPAEEAVGEGAAGERAVADRGPRRSEGRHDRQLADRGPRRSWVVERGVGEGGLDLNAPAFVGDRVQRQLDVGQQRSTGFGSLMPDQAEQPSPFSQRDSQSGLPGQQHVADSAREQANPQGLHLQQRLSFSSRKGAMMPPQQQAAAGTSLLSETFESTQEPVQQTGMGRDLLTEIHLWQKQMEEEEQGASSKARAVESQAWGDDFRAPGADSRAWGADSRAWGADSRAWGADSQAWERVSQVYSQGGMGRRWNRLAPVSGDELATQIAALAAADANADAAVGITSGIAAGIAVDGSMVRMPSVGNSLDKLPEQHEYPHTGEVSPLAKKVAELLGDIPFSVNLPAFFADMGAAHKIAAHGAAVAKKGGPSVIFEIAAGLSLGAVGGSLWKMGHINEKLTRMTPVTMRPMWNRLTHAELADAH
ncbi:unnamed protein product [Closterium sp. Yama58-4]|nr:unnamed protein product [Closterium sp. Yama58-4]